MAALYNHPSELSSSACKKGDRPFKWEIFLKSKTRSGFCKNHYFYEYFTMENMNSLISAGILVNVEVHYQSEYSNPLQNEYMFAYQITLENYNSFPVKLLRRNWFIFDSAGTYRNVEGEGVVGVQPVLEPGEHYQYMSGCNLRSDMGKMKGTYQMENMHNREVFTVIIPEFDMVAPPKFN